MAPEHEHYMRLALQEARKAGEAGNRAFGAVIVRGDAVVGQGGNCRESAMDPTGHAETTAIRDAVARLGSMDFSGCTIYATSEPCPMCCGAIAIYNIPTIVVGAMQTGVDRRYGDYTADKLIEMVGRGNQVIAGVLADDCHRALQAWDVKQGRAES